ncbi:hypothetical protein, partial [Rhizobium deserti]|uniref:hypothetical protein n=1 Tax=Rhizobium deserti TaxID=2547961 RepID=UPI001386DB0F
SWDVFYLRGSRDDAEAFAPFSRVLQYAKGQQDGGRDWAYDDYSFASNDMTLFHWDKIGARILCVLGEPGVVASADPDFPDEAMIDPSRIWQQGLRLGRMTRLRQIGDDLYAAGEGGQTYRRAGGAWEPLDRAFFRPEMDPDWDREFFPPGFLENGGDENEYLLAHPEIMRKRGELRTEIFRDDLVYGINGPNKDKIYICGKDGLLAVRTGEGGFRRLPEPTEQRLLDIALLDEERLVVCGEGILLVGNDRNGFRSAARIPEDLTLRRMAKFKDKLYLAAASGDGARGGLFVYDGASVEKVDTGLAREIGGLSWVSATDEMLLAVGHKEIVRFDGKAWDRIEYPGNATDRR